MLEGILVTEKKNLLRSLIFLLGLCTIRMYIPCYNTFDIFCYNENLLFFKILIRRNFISQRSFVADSVVADRTCHQRCVDDNNNTIVF